jgi:hypothetical protein
MSTPAALRTLLAEDAITLLILWATTLDYDPVRSRRRASSAAARRLAAGDRHDGDEGEGDPLLTRARAPLSLVTHPHTHQ